MSDSKISALTSYTNPDPVNDVLPIVDNTNTTTKKINRNNLLGITSAPVGKDDTQTLTAKTLTAPTINGVTLSGTLSGTYTIGGTPTFPASVVTLTGSQTLTNKILTSPTINAPTITNASITADAITGFSSANNGTIYGIAVTSSQIPTAAIQSNAVTFAKLATTIFSGQIASYANTGSGGGTVKWLNLGGLKVAWVQNAVSNASVWLTVDLTPLGLSNPPTVIATNTETTGSPPGWIEVAQISPTAVGAPQVAGFSFLSRTSASTNAVGTMHALVIGT